MIAAVVPRLYPNGQQPYFNGLLVVIVPPDMVYVPVPAAELPR